MKRGPKPKPIAASGAADYDLVYWIGRARSPDWIPENALAGNRASIRMLAQWAAMRFWDDWKERDGSIPANTEHGAFALALARIFERIAAGESPDASFGLTRPSDCEPAPADRWYRAFWLSNVAHLVERASEVLRESGARNPAPAEPKDRIKSAALAIGWKSPPAVLLDELASMIPPARAAIPANDARRIAAKLVSRGPGVPTLDGPPARPTETEALAAHRAKFVKSRNSGK